MEYLVERASTFAIDIDNVIILVAILGGFWLILAEFVLFYFIFKFQRKKHPKAAYVAGEDHEETKWVHWPHYIVILCDLVVIGFAVMVWYNVKQKLPPAESTVAVHAQQWGWRFQHPGPDNVIDTSDDVWTVDDLHLKVNTVYHFKLKSIDVIHDFSIPVFRLKQDIIPGRTITAWAKPNKTGDFDIQCAEMCGIGHGIMGARLHIRTEQEHMAWLNDQNNKYQYSKSNKKKADEI